ncbi:MAG: DUF4296 domain-containing protein [Bacteroidales bacterium]|nr:DUF4296 domain-containing protein [Bacteroidales bacterium]
MRSRSEKNSNIILKILLSGIVVSLLACSCSDRSSKTDHNDLIPEKTLISILTEVHIADGLLFLPKIRSTYSERDSVANYVDIIERYGYSKETMDRTMRYYFIKKPKKLIRIYDRILDKLSEMETYFTKEEDNTRSLFEDQWTGNSSYYLPDPTGNESVSFDLKLDKPGTYTLTFTVTLFPSDQSFKPHFTAYLCHPDSIETGKRIYLPAINYIKDGYPHTYILSKEIDVNSFAHLKGWFYDYENCRDDWQKHVRIDNISLRFILNVR